MLQTCEVKAKKQLNVSLRPKKMLIMWHDVTFGWTIIILKHAYPAKFDFVTG